MAAYTILLPPTSGGQTVNELPEGIRMVKWVLTSADPNGVAYQGAKYPDQTVHMFGTIGTATVALQGSNESDLTAPANLVTLHSPDITASATNTISFTTLPKLVSIMEDTWWIAPSLTTPGAGATVTVELLLYSPARR